MARDDQRRLLMGTFCIAVLVQGVGEVGRFEVHDWSLLGDDDLSRRGSDRQARLKGRDLADDDDDIIGAVLGKIWGADC